MSTVLPAASTSSVLPRADVPGTLAEASPEASQDRFLKLLVTQMRNQDPLNPMDNAQVTTQIAQISTVTGIDKVNGAITGLADAMSAASSLQNASLIGRSVVVPGERVRLADGPARVGVDLSSAADRALLVISDAAGVPVRSLDAGKLPAGVSTFEWDGRNDAGARLPAGEYRLRVEASRGSERIGGSSLVVANVDSVSIAAGRSRLNLGPLGSVDVSQIRRIDP
jgi:flagellar basal-body rod modification protein FlgD